MSSVQSTSPPDHQYPQEIQLKLYQAFIFSIPILFSIILFLLFYLFYLKRRALAISSSARSSLPMTINDAAITSPFDSDMKNELNNKLCRVVFDEYREAKESLCCVCLGEFEKKEELVEVESCKHMFHAECIRHWLHNNSTCPLCRAQILSSQDNRSRSHHHHHPHPSPDFTPSDHHQAVAPPTLQLQQCVRPEGSSSSTGGDSIY